MELSKGKVVLRTEEILARLFLVGSNFLKEKFFTWSFNENKGKLADVKSEVVLDKQSNSETGVEKSIIKIRNSSIS